MPESAPRKFTMADLMILIAGCAGGIAWTRNAYEATVAQMGGLLVDWRFRLPYLVMSPTPILASIGVALLACRLRHPRPAFRRLARQPGFVASSCTFALLVFEGGMLFANRALSSVVLFLWPPTPILGTVPFEFPLTLAVVGVVASSGLVIAACWLVMLAVGRWRPEPSWVDRSGRFLGACWIAMHIAAALTGSLIV